MPPESLRRVSTGLGRTLLMSCPGAKVAVAPIVSWNSMPLVMPCLPAPVFRIGCRCTWAFDIQQVITEAIFYI
jgi:hypothetical protein